ncbi:MAG: hypothetical protein O3A95_08015 [Planctomycetota bacterium]|nr:hypothetical protein [Planctomycetota bacterium]MDA1114227.1 hypothetical protein [Planctomycetota bacterium]
MSWLGLVLSLACFAQEEAAPPPPDPRVLLHEAVSALKPKEREAAVKRLTQLRSVNTDQWLEIMHAFGDFDDASPGAHQLEIEAWVDEQRVPLLIDFYVPPSYDSTMESPLLVLLHGSGGKGGGMLRSWTQLADQHGYLLLAPTDPESVQGYAFTQRERDEVLQALRWMRLHYNVDENRVHLHGVSRGGHLAWDLGTRHSDHFASLVPAIGGPTWVVSQGRNNLRLVENLAGTPIRQLQGSQDDPRLLRNLRLSFDRIRAAGNDDAMLIEFPELGHSYRTDTIDWPKFFGSHPRNPWPGSITYRTARKENLRRSWLHVSGLTKAMDESFGITVDPKEWQRMNEEQRAAYIQNMAEERTSKSHVTRKQDGSFVVQTQGVSRCSLFLQQEWLGEKGKITVVVNGKSMQLKAKTSKNVLLQDFVERFDRTFLPVAEVQIKKF